MAGERPERRRARGVHAAGERVWILAPAVVIAGVAATVALALVPGAGFAFHGPKLQAAIEAASALVSVLAAYLLVGRFLLGRRLDDLALVMAATTLAVTNLAFSTVPAIA